MIYNCRHCDRSGISLLEALVHSSSAQGMLCAQCGGRSNVPLLLRVVYAGLEGGMVILLVIAALERQSYVPLWFAVPLIAVGRVFLMPLLARRV